MNGVSRYLHIKSVAACVIPVLCALASWPVAAQASWPNAKPISLIVPWSPGGVADFLGRQLADSLTKQLNQTVIVENKPGAGTNIGSADVANAAPDGYTLLLASSANAANMSLYKRMRYDTRTDFTPVTLVGYTPMVLVANPSVRQETLLELIAHSKDHPGEIAYASAGAGSPAHLAGELFKHETKVDWLHIPYKGAGPAITDLMGGQVQTMFTNVPASLGGIRSGKLRAFAITGEHRSPALPDTPTFAEAGLPSFPATGWYGVFAPVGTPEKIVQKLNMEIEQALTSPDQKKRVTDQGVEISILGPDEFKVLVASDIEFYRELTEEIGIRSNL